MSAAGVFAGAGRWIRQVADDQDFGDDTREIPVIDGEVVEDYPTTVIPFPRLLPPVPQSARVAARLPLSARLSRRRQVFLASDFVADVVERRYLLAGCVLVLAVAAAVAWMTAGTYWNGSEWAPIPVGGTR